MKWLEGTCPRKNECMFSHLKAVSSATKPRRLGICFAELKQAGTCAWSTKCKFSHDISEEDRGSIELQASAMEERRNKKGICVNEYRCQNSCLKGEGCPFRHNISEQERKSEVLKQKMEEKWRIVTGQSKKVTEEGLNKPTAIIMLQEFRTLMKKFNQVISTRSP